MLSLRQATAVLAMPMADATLKCIMYVCTKYYQIDLSLHAKLKWRKLRLLQCPKQHRIAQSIQHRIKHRQCWTNMVAHVKAPGLKEHVMSKQNFKERSRETA